MSRTKQLLEEYRLQEWVDYAATCGWTCLVLFTDLHSRQTWLYGRKNSHPALLLSLEEMKGQQRLLMSSEEYAYESTHTSDGELIK